MPMNLGDLEFLNAILDKTIDSTLSALSDESPTTANTTATTTTTANATVTTTSMANSSPATATAKKTIENLVTASTQTNSSKQDSATITPLTSIAESQPKNIPQEDQT